MKSILQKTLLSIVCLLCSIGAMAHDFEVDGLYYKITDDNIKTVALTYYGDLHYNVTDKNRYKGSVVIPESVTYEGTTYSVTSIDERTFNDCLELTSVTIPESITKIGAFAFSYCVKLTEVIIPNSVILIENSAFQYCKGMTSLIIGDNVTLIDSWAFDYCQNLTSVTIGSKVTLINEYAFRRCMSLTSITIPSSVTTINNEAFNKCKSLKNVIIADGEETLYLGHNNYDSSNKTGEGLFSDCPIENLYLGRNLSYYDTGDYSPFYNITTLKSVTFGGGFTWIKINLLRSCTGLTEITIPNNIREIGSRALEYCTNLTEITCLATTPINITGLYDPFNGIDKSIPVYVPAGSIEAYKKALSWKEFNNYQGLKANATTNKVYYLDFSNEWDVNEGTLHAIFTNANTGIEITIKGEIVNSSAIFHLAEGNSYATTGVENALYTHVEFTLTNPQAVTRSGETTLTTGALYLADADKYIYNLANKEWIGVNQATDIEETVTESAIEVRGDVVTALGDIYIYNMSGVMVAYGYNEVNISDLAQGVYIILTAQGATKIVL